MDADVKKYIEQQIAALKKWVLAQLAKEVRR